MEQNRCKFITCYSVISGMHNVNVKSKDKAPEANMLLGNE